LEEHTMGLDKAHFIPIVDCSGNRTPIVGKCGNCDTTLTFAPHYCHKCGTQLLYHYTHILTVNGKDRYYRKEEHHALVSMLRFLKRQFGSNEYEVKEIDIITVLIERI